MSYIEVSNTNEIPAGRTKHVEVHEVEILLANVDGKFYAVSDRCEHQNALLSKGELEGKIITCPPLPARFDVTTGKLVSDPVAHAFPGIERAPKNYWKHSRVSGR